MFCEIYGKMSVCSDLPHNFQHDRYSHNQKRITYCTWL